MQAINAKLPAESLKIFIEEEIQAAINKNNQKIKKNSSKETSSF